jgi:hypothetical protein
MSRSPIATLRAFAAHKLNARERCDFCSQAVGPEHAHVLDENGAPKCACMACALLFPEQTVAQFRRIDSRAQRLPMEIFSEAQWAALGIPVGLAWFFRDAKDGRLRAMYPGAAGSVEGRAQVAPEAGMPAMILTLEPGTEALLVRRSAQKGECWRVSMDHCWRLAGLLRRHWRGFAGGADVHARVDAFFTGLAS